MRDRYERRHRWTRWDHPNNLMNTPGLAERMEATESLLHAMTIDAADTMSQCADPMCVCHTRSAPNPSPPPPCASRPA